MMNIGGSDDPFFRYKMPDIQVKVEGRGNGIKTVIPNMAEIGEALKRDPGYPTKFFAIELGALSQWDAQRNVGIVNGEHSKPVFAKLLAQFVERYVLCPQCKNPETDLKVKKGMIHFRCKACGERGLSDNQHKLSTYIVNHPPAGSEDKNKKGGKKDKKDKKAKREEKKKGKKDKKGQDDETTEGDAPSTTADDDNGSPDGSQGDDDDKPSGGEEDGEIHFKITEEMKNMKVNEANAHIEDPVAILKGSIGSAKDVKEQVSRFEKFKKQQDFDDIESFKYLIKALVGSSMATEVQANLKLIKKTMPAGREGQNLMIALIEERCEAHPDNLAHVSKTLQTLYFKDLLEEECVMDWNEKGLSQLIALADHPASVQTREAAKQFIEWLENAEEESDDEGDD